MGRDKAMQEVRFRKGETIFTEGEPGADCYKIVSGKVEISLKLRGILKRGRSETIATCLPGEIIGAMSAIEKGPRSATAIAAEPTVCMACTPDEFMESLENDPLEALTYIRTLIKNQRHSNRALAGGPGRYR